MRDNQWLLEIIRHLWQKYFGDIPIKNTILVLFSRPNKRVLGSIKYNRKSKVTEIRITAYFKDEFIPLKVVQATLAHEIVHYTHGFSAPGKKLYRYPHQGGIITQELRHRGLSHLEKESKQWLKENWQNYLKRFDF